MEKKTYNWNRKLLNYLWVMVGVSFVVPIINYPFTDLELMEFIVFRIAIPLSIQLLVMLSLEYLNRKRNSNNDYITILGSMAMVLAMNLAHVTVVHVMLPLFILPIFIGIFTIEAKKILFSFVISFFSFVVLNILHPIFDFDTVESITFLFVLCSAAYLSLEITKRYKHLNQELLKSVSNEKELLYKNIHMEKMSKMDLPTNLYNHKTFHEHLERLWESFNQNSFEFHLAVLDLDNFKKINDVFGHAVGDVVIRETAEIINAFVDTNDYASRYGGEEFAILFTEKSLHSCLATLELIRKSLEAFKFDDMGSNNVTVSIGIAGANHYRTKEEFFKSADDCLYMAKACGKNQIVTDLDKKTCKEGKNGNPKSY
jgi:diguanylate cyclase (GGDEF)-like protein